MSYPYGPTVSPTLPDLPQTVLQRRQGDVKATLIQIILNNQPVNLAGYTFIFSVTLPSGLSTVTWTIDSASTGVAITTVDGSGFLIPPFDASVTASFVSTATMNQGDFIDIGLAGVYLVQSVLNGTTAVIQNMGFDGNLFSGSVSVGTLVYDIGQVGMTVLVIPSSMTSNPVGMYPCYCKYRTADPFPGPYVNTFLQGQLQLFTQNDPNG